MELCPLKVGVAWSERGSDSTAVFQVVFRKSTNTGLTWSYPHEVVSGRSDGAWQPDLAWNRTNDIAYLVWIDYTGGNGELYYSTLEGDTWTDHGQFTDDTMGTVDEPDLAINDEGETFLVWVDVTETESIVKMGELASP
jgi:hypothetical protein